MPLAGRHERRRSRCCRASRCQTSREGCVGEGPTSLQAKPARIRRSQRGEGRGLVWIVPHAISMGSAVARVSRRTARDCLNGGGAPAWSFVLDCGAPFRIAGLDSSRRKARDARPPTNLSTTAWQQAGSQGTALMTRAAWPHGQEVGYGMGDVSHMRSA